MHIPAEYLRRDILAALRDGIEKCSIRSRTQKEIGSLIENSMSQPAISKFLNGKTKKIRYSHAKKFCEVFDLNIDRYLNRQPPPIQKDEMLNIVDSEFDEIRAYDATNGMTYVGRFVGDNLEDACTLVTADTVTGARLTNVHRREEIKFLYNREKGNSRLDTYHNFSRLEKFAAHVLLGNRKEGTGAK